MIKTVETKCFKLKDINPSTYNPRRIRPENQEGLRASMSRFGCVEDIVVNVRAGRKVIVGGHQRYEILLKENGPEYRASCKVVKLPAADEKALNVALNNPHIQGEFTEVLPEHIRKIREELEDDMAFVSMRLDQLRGQISEASADGETEGEVPFTRELMEENNYLVFAFSNKIDWQAARDIFGLRTVQSLDSKPGYHKSGIGRVLSGEKLIRAMQGDKPDDFYTELQKV